MPTTWKLYWEVQQAQFTVDLKETASPPASAAAGPQGLQKPAAAACNSTESQLEVQDRLFAALQHQQMPLLVHKGCESPQLMHATAQQSQIQELLQHQLLIHKACRKLQLLPAAEKITMQDQVGVSTAFPVYPCFNIVDVFSFLH